jgi:hypothetical protein
MEAAEQQRKAAEQLAHQTNIDVDNNGTVTVTETNGNETVKVNVPAKTSK